MSLPYHSLSCPGLFYKTSAQDGILSRIRIPGGIVTTTQFCVLADLADEFGTGYVQITNRGNLQIREIRKKIAADVLKALQKTGIASSIPEVDHIRNIMGSPTAGIDPDELIDVRSLIREWDDYITTHAELAQLSPKFSVAFDGGGSVSIGDRLNDIALNAVIVGTEVYFCLKLSLGISQVELVDTGILLKPEEYLEVVAALAQVYLQHLAVGSGKVIAHRKSCQPRLREVVNELGMERFLQEVERYLSKRLQRFSPTRRNVASINTYKHIGIHPQRQKGLFYVGVVLPVGKLETWQMRGLAAIAQADGSGTIRLTPWQNLLISDIPQQCISNVQSKIDNLGLHWSATNIRSALVACTGNKGCASSATDTKGHALALAEYLDHRLSLDQPINIHFTGCHKSCAQQSKSDITLVGITIDHKGEMVEGYTVYIGDSDSNEKFGREVYNGIPFAELPQLVERILQIYMTKRTTPNESLREFANRYAIADLQRLFEQSKWLVEKLTNINYQPTNVEMLPWRVSTTNN